MMTGRKAAEANKIESVPISHDSYLAVWRETKQNKTISNGKFQQENKQQAVINHYMKWFLNKVDRKYSVSFRG